jgi:multidrug efflux pump subunit AcrA (membrane-fusion protein)
MIYRTFLFLGGAIVLGLATACGPKDGVTKTAPASPPTETPPDAKKEDASFDPDKGLYLSEATRQSMGITTASVQKKTFQAERTMKFQIFREADEQSLPGMAYRFGFAYASAILTGEKIDLGPGQVGEVMEKGEAPAKLFQVNALPNSNQAELLVEITDPQNQFILGQFCTVRWLMTALDVPAAVPDSALLKTTEGNFVYLQKGDRFVRAEVKPGATGEGFTEITDGVAAGDSVVTNPVQTLWLTELKLKSGGSEP